MHPSNASLLQRLPFHHHLRQHPGQQLKHQARANRLAILLETSRLLRLHKSMTNLLLNLHKQHLFSRLHATLRSNQKPLQLPRYRCRPGQHLQHQHPCQLNRLPLHKPRANLCNRPRNRLQRRHPRLPKAQRRQTAVIDLLQHGHPFSPGLLKALRNRQLLKNPG